MVKDIKDKLQMALFRTVIRLHREIVENIPVDTGRLRNSITFYPFEPSLEYEIGTNMPYMKYLELGTGIYGERHRKITPKKAKALHWKDKNTGKDIFARSVKGIKPHRIFEKAMLKVKDILREELSKI